MFVVHFVGDIHQPLHATTNNDRGGNCIPVKFFNRKPRLTNASTGSYKPNLHGVWDTEIVERVGKIGGSHDTNVQAFADHLAVEFASDIPTWQSTPPDFEAWAWESHELAVNISYGRLPRSVSVETPKSVDNCTDDNNVSARMKTLTRKPWPALRYRRRSGDQRTAGKSRNTPCDATEHIRRAASSEHQWRSHRAAPGFGPRAA